MKISDIMVTDLELSVRAERILKEQGIETVADLRKVDIRAQIDHWPGLGRITMVELLNCQRRFSNVRGNSHERRLIEAVAKFNNLMVDTDPEAYRLVVEEGRFISLCKRFP